MSTRVNQLNKEKVGQNICARFIFEIRNKIELDRSKIDDVTIVHNFFMKSTENVKNKIKINFCDEVVVVPESHSQNLAQNWFQNWEVKM